MAPPTWLNSTIADILMGPFINSRITGCSNHTRPFKTLSSRFLLSLFSFFKTFRINGLKSCLLWCVSTLNELIFKWMLLTGQWRYICSIIWVLFYRKYCWGIGNRNVQRRSKTLRPLHRNRKIGTSFEGKGKQLWGKWSSLMT